MEHLRNSFHLPQNIPNDLIDAHLYDLRVWTLDYLTWQISLTYTTPVRTQKCIRLSLFSNAKCFASKPYGTLAQQSGQGLTTTFFQPSTDLYSGPTAIEFAAFRFHPTTTFRDVYTAMSASIPGYRLVGGDNGTGHQGWVVCVIDFLTQAGYLHPGAPQGFVRRLLDCRAASVLARDQIEWPISNTFFPHSSTSQFE